MCTFSPFFVLFLPFLELSFHLVPISLQPKELPVVFVLVCLADDEISSFLRGNVFFILPSFLNSSFTRYRIVDWQVCFRLFLRHCKDAIPWSSGEVSCHSCCTLTYEVCLFSLRFFAFIFARRRLSYFALIELLGFVCWCPLPNLGSFWLLFFLSSTFFPLPFSLSLFRLGLRLHKIGMFDIAPQVLEVLFCVFVFFLSHFFPLMFRFDHFLLIFKFSDSLSSSICS